MLVKEKQGTILGMVLFVILFQPGKSYCADPNTFGLEGSKLITAERLKAQLTFIASDELEGRETSYRGQKLASLYIAQQFEQMGLMPAGDSGTYYQHFPLLHLSVDTNGFLMTSTAAGTKSWRAFGKDIIPHSSRKDTTISGDIEFVGYGINSKILQFTEYDSTINYKGKIVLALRGTPGDDDSTTVFFSHKTAGTAGAKRTYAQWGGAAGVLIVEDTKGRTMEEAYEECRDDLTRGLITIPQRVRNELPLFSVSRKVANELLASSGKTIEWLQHEIDSTKKPASFELKDAKATLAVKMNREEVISENVIGLLPGSDSLLKNEYVVFSAHYDHVGKNTVTGEIYNGADDDGSGTCAVLEMAHAFASLQERPKRSLIFLAVAGEEKGLLGSLYYTEHPTIPLEKTVTDLNIDMIGRFDPDHEKTGDTDYVYIIGSDKLSAELDSTSRAANNESVRLHLDYTYNDESEPHQFYRRSDHYNFAKKNIPIIFYFDGEHPDYHKPTDKVAKINFDILVKRSRLIFYTGWKIANARKRPALDGESSKSSSPESR
jgi:hypothetical protein